MSENKILLCRLSKMLPNIAGKWTLPGGGVEFGEDPAETVLREVLEETGMSVRATQVAGVHSYTSESRGHKFHSIRIIYRTELLGGELRFESEGSTDQCAWFCEADAQRLPLVNLGEVGLALAFANARAS